ncbi:MAG: dimethylmenaquinone methyltransferase [Bryobacteraceae bacterium]
MISRFPLTVLIASGFLAQAQVFTLSHDQMVEYTAKNPFGRFEDGRPKVPDELLKKFDDLSAEEIWAVLQDRYPNQYEGNFKILHPEKKLIGRAVTAQFMPYRADVAGPGEAAARARGLGHNSHQRVIDTLQTNDVAVFDLFGKVEGGTVTGDNLATAVYMATKTGFVVDGSIRDLDGIFEIPMGLYYREAHPTPIRNVMLTGVNIPVRIGHATVMPGDVVFGDREGVYFVPPEMVKEVLDRAEITHIHDEWTKKMFDTGKYKSSQVYPSPPDPQLKKDYREYLNRRLKEKGLERLEEK